METFLRQAVENLRAALGNNLIGVALYGSRARGEAREDSDVDLLVVARKLPEHWQKRTLLLHDAVRGIRGAPEILIYGKTPEEFESGFPSIYLDMGLDGIVLYDRDSYLARKLERIREIIKEAGLVRYRLSPTSLCWNWQVPPEQGWEITWEGYRELA